MLLENILFVALLVAGAVSTTHASAVLADLENALMCECEDKCGKVLINCNCATSDKHRTDLKRHMESGLNKDQIMEQLDIPKTDEEIKQEAEEAKASAADAGAKPADGKEKDPMKALLEANEKDKK